MTKEEQVEYLRKGNELINEMIDELYREQVINNPFYGYIIDERAEQLAKGYINSVRSRLESRLHESLHEKLSIK